MQIVLGNKEFANATTFMKCSGCNESLEVKIDWDSGFDWKDAPKVANDIGWMRRKFATNAEPWFCSKLCAFESEEARYMEEYWNQNFWTKVLGWFNGK